MNNEQNVEGLNVNPAIAKPMLAVVYRLSNNEKENVLMLPKDAKNIKGYGIYLSYDLPIDTYGSMTHFKHLGYDNAFVEVVKIVEPKYRCNLCGRDKFDKPSPHRCISGFRKRKIEWSLNYR